MIMIRNEKCGSFKHLSSNNKKMINKIEENRNDNKGQHRTR